MVTRIASIEIRVAEPTRDPRDAGDEALDLFAQDLVRGQEFGQIVRLIGRASSGSSNRSRTGEGSRASRDVWKTRMGSMGGRRERASSMLQCGMAAWIEDGHPQGVPLQDG